MSKSKFPKVNYIGNKEKLLDWIISNLPINKGKVLDVFSGGGSFSYRLKEVGYEVISNDVLYSSYVLTKSLVENQHEKLELETILKVKEIRLTKEDKERFSWLSNHLFYDYEVLELSKFIKLSEELEGYKKYMLQALIRRAMIRKLPYSRMNVGWENIKKLRDEEYSYKKYKRSRAYHNLTFEHHILDNLESYNNAVFDNKKNNKSYQKDVMKIMDILGKVDLIYMDPPYPNTMNNYSSFYGVFEKIFDKEIKYSDWTKSDSFMKLLIEFIEGVKNKTQYIMLSINTKASPSYKDIYMMMKNYGTVKLVSKKHNYQLTGKENKNTDNELLLILKLH